MIRISGLKPGQVYPSENDGVILLCPVLGVSSPGSLDFSEHVVATVSMSLADFTPEFPARLAQVAKSMLERYHEPALRHRDVLAARCGSVWLGGLLWDLDRWPYPAELLQYRMVCVRGSLNLLFFGELDLI